MAIFVCAHRSFAALRMTGRDAGRRIGKFRRAEEKILSDRGGSFDYNRKRKGKGNMFFKNLFSQPDLRKLENLKRYTPASTILFGKKINIVDGMSFVFMYKEIFGKEIYRFSTRDKTPVIVDGGANIGLGVIYFKRRFPESKVIGFEPDPVIFGVLRANIGNFGFSGVELIQKALWSGEITVPFHVEGADGGRISKAVDKDPVEVQAVRLKGYLDTRIDFLKLDIEGAEYTVLKDCENCLGNVDRIFVEYHSFLNEPQYLDDILSILRRNGFRYWIHHIGIFSQRPLDEIRSNAGMDMQLNIYASR